MGLARMLRIREADDEGERIKLPADYSARLTLVLGAILTVLFFVQIVLLGLFQGFSIFDELAWTLAPGFALGFTVVSVILGCVSSPIIVVGVARESRSISKVGFVLVLLAMLFNFIVLVIMLLTGNGVVVARNNDNDSDIDGNVGLNSFTNDIQRKIIDFGVDDEPELWEEIQDELGCCGLSIQTLYEGVLRDYDFFDFHSGLDCSLLGGETEIELLKTQVPDFADENGNVLAVEAVLENENQFPQLSGISFLCEVDLAEKLKGRAQNYSILFGFQTIVTAILAFCVGLLLFSYEEDEGGMKPNEQDLSMQARAIDTSVKKAGFGTQRVQSQGGSVKIGTNKSRANNVRFK